MNDRADDRLGARIALALLLAALGIFVSQCVAIGDARIDDAYFTFSFAKNLALGNGPVYSHGVRVEGHSAFLWMLLLVPGLVITRGSAPLDVARVMGAPFIALLGWSTYRLARALGASRPVAAASVVLLSFHTDLAVAYLTGMETLPFVALLALALALTARSFHEPRYAAFVPWAGLALALMRIDGFVPCGFIAGCALVRELGAGEPQPLRTFARRWAPALALYGLWFGWRWSYYGLPLPSTYYAKALIAEAMPRRGLEYLFDEVSSAWTWIGVVAWHWLLWRRNRAAALLGAYAILGAAYVVRVGGDWMPFARFLLPLLPLQLALCAAACTDLNGIARALPRPLHMLVALAPLGLAAVMATRADHRFLNDRLERSKVADVQLQRANVKSYLRAAKFLRQVVPAGGRLVTDYGGVFGYYTDASVIEMWGLANALIATQGTTTGVNPIYGKTCPECYRALEPEFFHVGAPIVRPEPAFRSASEVLAHVWQHDTIGRYVDLRAEFAVGRVARPARGEALYFLQRRGPAFSAHTRRSGEFVIDYPFESSHPPSAASAAVHGRPASR